MADSEKQSPTYGGAATSQPPPLTAHEHTSQPSTPAADSQEEIKKTELTATSLSLYPLTFPEVSDEELRQFHGIDRQLFVNLTHRFGHHRTESVQIIAFLMTLERVRKVNLVGKIVRRPDSYQSQLAYEVALCLKCIKNDPFLFADSETEMEILPSIIRGLSLRSLHQHRITALRAVDYFARFFCSQAFFDLLRPPQYPMQFMQKPDLSQVPLMGKFPARPPLMGSFLAKPPLLGNYSVEPPLVGNSPARPPLMGNSPACNGARQNRVTQADDLGDLVSENSNIAGEESGDRVAADDRTIFLQFKKGSPPTEEVVRDYFTGYGIISNFIILYIRDMNE